MGVATPPGQTRVAALKHGQDMPSEKLLVEILPLLPQVTKQFLKGVGWRVVVSQLSVQVVPYILYGV